MLDQNKDTFCLNSEYSTTRLVTREKPVIVNKPEDAFETVLFLPECENRTGQGGLRTQGLFKRSLPDKPLITVITVVLNGAEHLEETILSVLNQTYGNVEYIVIDGGSTDGTLDIIQKYEHAIDYWVSEKDAGIYDAMNKGISLAAGNWILYLNVADKILFLDQNSLKKNHTNTGYYFNENNSILQRDPFTKVYLTHNTPCHQSIFYKRDEILLFNINYKVISDYDQMTKICNNFVIGDYSEHITFFSKYSISKEFIKINKVKYLFDRVKISFENMGVFYAILSTIHVIRILLFSFIKYK